MLLGCGLQAGDPAGEAESTNLGQILCRHVGLCDSQAFSPKQQETIK